MMRVVDGPKLLLPTFVFLLACGCSNEGSNKNTESNPTMGADAATPKADGATVPVTVTGPITGGRGKPFTTSIVDLGANGYGEKEFFYEGDATAYALEGEMTMDGKWKLMETSKESYKSRMIVRRPSDAAKFNGTVVVEWLNVSGGADGDPGFMYNW
ncbi:MAG TPA: alpha/beta hydrolase domain-containing protein, partial [Polyangiaceae bacterium]|nr:alpha/beta hydrolase domain-containing protein [Polyangiaceae bacterium]